MQPSQYGRQAPRAQQQQAPLPPSHVAQFTASKSNDYSLEDDDDDEDDTRYGRQAQRGVTPDGYYEDIYGQYAQMDSAVHTSAVPYTTRHTQHTDIDIESKDADLARNQSTSDRTEKTSASSMFGGLRGKKPSSTTVDALTNGGRTTAQHQRGLPSIAERTLPLSSPASRRFGWFPRSWPARLFLLVTLAEAAADISIEAVLLSRFRQQQGSISVTGGNLSALPVFVMVFGMAHVYQVFLTIDSIVNRNTILVFGLVLFNLAFLVYALIQIIEIRDVLGDGVIPGTSQSVPVQVLTGAIPVIIGVSSLIFAILAWYLWREFGWQIYKTIGADRKLKRAHLHFQIFVCLLKFDFFTFIAYCLQLVLVVLSKDNPEFWVTTMAAPVTLIILIFAWYAVRMEHKWCTVSFMVALWGGAGYFVYKLYRIWQQRLGVYKDVYKSLTVFSVLALALMLATFVVTIRCLMNFDMGLKNAMARSALERKQLREDEMGPVISTPFHYDLDSPHGVAGAQGGAGHEDSGDDVVPIYGAGGVHSPNRYNNGTGEAGYFASYAHSQPRTGGGGGGVAPMSAYNLSSQGLLSPVRSPQALLPLRNPSSSHLERQTSQAHRLSLD